MFNRFPLLSVVAMVLSLIFGTLAGLTNTAFDGLAPLVLVAGVLIAGVCGAIAVLQYRAGERPILAPLVLMLALVGVGMWSLVLIDA